MSLIANSNAKHPHEVADRWHVNVAGIGRLFVVSAVNATRVGKHRDELRTCEWLVRGSLVQTSYLSTNSPLPSHFEWYVEAAKPSMIAL